MRAIVVLLFLFSFPTFSNETIYFAAYEPVSRTTALVYSSSGGNFWQTKIKGKGLVGAQASGFCEAASPETYLENNMSAPELVREIYKQCHAVGWESYRALAITQDGAIDFMIAANGCHSNNQYCGALRSTHHAVVGGGLEKGVLKAAMAAYDANANETFACRLFKTLESIYSSGGETKDFVGASITLDDPTQSELSYWEARGEEAELLPALKASMIASGVHCTQ